MMSTPSVWLNAVLPCDVVHEFPVSGGGTLRIGPGAIPCRVGYGAVRGWLWREPEDVEHPPEENAWIETHVELADRGGHVFRCSRFVEAHLFLMVGSRAAFHGRDASDLRGLKLIAKHLHSVAGRAGQYIVLGTRDGSGLHAFAYKLKNNYATFDLFVWTIAEGVEQLAVWLYPKENRGWEGSPTPASLYVTELAAVMVMWPQLIGDTSVQGHWALPEIVRTIETAAPQPNVRFMPAEDSAPNAD